MPLDVRSQPLCHPAWGSNVVQVKKSAVQSGVQGGVLNRTYLCFASCVSSDFASQGHIH